MNLSQRQIDNWNQVLTFMEKSELDFMHANFDTDPNADTLGFDAISFIFLSGFFPNPDIGDTFPSCQNSIHWYTVLCNNFGKDAVDALMGDGIRLDSRFLTFIGERGHHAFHAFPAKDASIYLKEFLKLETPDDIKSKEHDALLKQLNQLLTFYKAEADKARNRIPHNTHPSHWSYQEAVQAEQAHNHTVHVLKKTIAHLTHS